MTISRTALKKSFNFNSLPQNESQVHILRFSQLKAFEKSLPESLKKQYAQKKVEWKADKDTTCSLHFSEGGYFKIISLGNESGTFNRHSTCRKFLAPLFKSGEQNIHVNLGLLKQEEALFWVDALTSLKVLESWEYPKVTNEKKKDDKKDFTLTFHTNLTASQFDKQAMVSQATAEATNKVRTLALTPPNYLNPGLYREEAKRFAAAKKLKFEFWDRKELQKKGAGAFLAVTQADPNDEGGIARLVYKPKSAKSKAVLTLVGKGLCFDTGGYNIKVGNYMKGMHEDMTGSAVALASIGMFADINFPLEVHAYLAIAENHLSPTGFKSNDVVTASNGKTIEIENTDAEGRMVLADTLALASKEKPALIIDYATLTGACFRALSTYRSGLFTNREKLLPLVTNLGEQAGEKVWGFPISGDYEQGLKSDVADLLQCAHEANADHIYAATFLNHFVEKDVPWVHIDLSAHAHKGGLGLVSTETNGWGCRLTRTIGEALLNGNLKKYL